MFSLNELSIAFLNKDFFNILILEEKTETQVTQPTPSEQRSRIAETQTQDAQLTISGQTSRATKIVNNVKKNQPTI